MYEKEEIFIKKICFGQNASFVLFPLSIIVVDLLNCKRIDHKWYRSVGRMVTMSNWLVS